MRLNRKSVTVGLAGLAIAGVLSSLVSGSGITLALTSSTFSVLAWLVWRHEQRDQHRLRTASAAQVMGLEPTDEM